MNVPRKAYVDQTGTPPYLRGAYDKVPLRPHVSAANGSQGVSPPFVGGFNSAGQYSGLMSALPQGAQVLVLSEGDTARGGLYPSASVCMTDTAAKLPALNPGETAIYGTDGRVLCQVLNTGVTNLYSKPGGVTISVDNSKNIAATGAATATLSGHILHTGTAPTAVLGAAAGNGTGGGYAMVNADDRRGTIYVTTTSANTAAGILVSVLFAASYATAPTIVVSASGSSTAMVQRTAALQVGAVASTGAVNIIVNAAPAVSTQYAICWMVEG